jgi:hypothetical protein
MSVTEWDLFGLRALLAAWKGDNRHQRFGFRASLLWRIVSRANWLVDEWAWPATNYGGNFLIFWLITKSAAGQVDALAKNSVLKHNFNTGLLDYN